MAKLSRAFLDGLFDARPRVKREPCSVARDQPTWRAFVNGKPCLVKANTKSEARAAYKRMRGVSRLPVGTAVRKVVGP